MSSPSSTRLDHLLKYAFHHPLLPRTVTHAARPQIDPIPAHDVLVKTGGMSQILLWTSFAEIFGAIALFQTVQGKRVAGDYSFDPLSLSVRPPPLVLRTPSYFLCRLLVRMHLLKSCPMTSCLHCAGQRPRQAREVCPRRDQALSPRHACLLRHGPPVFHHRRREYTTSAHPPSIKHTSNHQTHIDLPHLAPFAPCSTCCMPPPTVFTAVLSSTRACLIPPSSALPARLVTR